MTINYDKVADAIYLNIKTSKIKETVKMNDCVVIDLDNKKNVVGIEILNASSNAETIRTLEKNVLTGIPIEISSITPSNA